jgi:sugar/nucleoside kinase (ribokinase family)
VLFNSLTRLWIDVAGPAFSGRTVRIKSMTDKPGVELCVAGLVYFEVFVPTLRLPAAGEEAFVDSIQLGLGGALNTASVAAALGLNVLLAHPRGNGLADDAIAQRIAHLGIASTHWPSRRDPAVSLVFSGATDRAFVSAADFASLQQCQTLPAARWIHVPGLLEARYLARPLARARAAGARISVSGSWAPEELAALGALSHRPWDLLILNDKEAAFAAEDPQLAPDRLQGAAASVVVTAGAAGAFGRLDGVWASCPAVPVQAIDFTGAGDAFCAGLLSSLLRGGSAEEALRLGCGVAAKMLTHTGGVAQDPAWLAEPETRT